jgi:DNA-binding NarL/FixJ family response regulator
MRELHERSPDAVFLALTSGEVPGQNQSALEHGADVVLAKTAPRAELLQTLRMLKANMEFNEENVSHLQRSEQGT